MLKCMWKQKFFQNDSSLFMKNSTAAVQAIYEMFYFSASVMDNRYSEGAFTRNEI